MKNSESKLVEIPGHEGKYFITGIDKSNIVKVCKGKRDKAGDMQMEEIWKQIPDTNGKYEVSNLGKVRRNKILKPEVSNCGYLRVGITFNSGRRKMSVHRLVAITFIPNPDNCAIVNHKDGNKTNNAVFNLEWCNTSENVKHAFKTHLKRARKGAEHPQAKKVAMYDSNMNLVRIFGSRNECATYFKDCGGNIGKACKRPEKKYRNFFLKYL